MLEAFQIFFFRPNHPKSSKRRKVCPQNRKLSVKCDDVDQFQDETVRITPTAAKNGQVEDQVEDQGCKKQNKTKKKPNQ